MQIFSGTIMFWQNDASYATKILNIRTKWIFRLYSSRNPISSLRLDILLKILFIFPKMCHQHEAVSNEFHVPNWYFRDLSDGHRIFINYGISCMFEVSFNSFKNKNRQYYNFCCRWDWWSSGKNGILQNRFRFVDIFFSFYA